MFAKVYQITAIIEKNIGYVKEARANGLGDDQYFADMESRIKHSLERLKKESTNKRLVTKYEKMVSEVF